MDSCKYLVILSIQKYLQINICVKIEKNNFRVLQPSLIDALSVNSFSTYLLIGLPL